MELIKTMIWGAGKIVIFTGLLACISFIIFWLRVEKKGTIFKLKFWKIHSTQLLVLTYFHLISSYILNFSSFAWVSSTPKLMNIISKYPYQVVIGAIIAMTILTTLLESITYCQENNLIKITAWFLHSTTLGFPIAYFGELICIIAAMETLIMIGLSSVMAYLAPDDFYKVVEKRLSYLYYLVLVSSIYSLLFEPPASNFAVFMLALNFFGGMVLYFGVFLINTQFMLNDVLTNEQYDPIYTSAVMYLCTMNLFIRNAFYIIVKC